ncbi:MAG: hypothetical protein CSA68_11670 [Rhodobacterales bacterium]|nr:MAG: hypothetical protein CSA68_11670 [Rhodobacterales bacterium]
MITDQLINRLHLQAADRLSEKVREGRRHALSSISSCCVVVTDDGRDTREVVFDQPPTIGQLEARVGSDAWVVSVRMRRVPRTRQRRATAAE